MTDEADTRPTNKVDRVAAAYGLEGLGDELERRWLGEGSDAASTRELADLFNRRVLAAAIDESAVFTLDGDVEGAYRTLTDEGDADRSLVRSRMEQGGIDVDAVLGDFVSHQTIHRYLTDHRGVEQSGPDDAERSKKAVERIQRLRGRTTAVTEETVERLRASGTLTVEEFSVLNDIQVLCEGCGRSYDVVELIERGHCACETE